MATILIIDDDPQVRTVLAEALSLHGYHVLTAGDGTEGLRMARESGPDLILCDIVMEGLDGLSTLKAVRNDPRTAGIPLIIITGAGEAGGMRRAMGLGANDYLEKPFRISDLLDSVQARLAQQQVVDREVRERLRELRRSISLALPHELRTPLTNILTAARLLVREEEPSPGEVRRFSGLILQAGERLHHLLENFLIYAQVEVFRADPGAAAELRRAVLREVGPLVSGASVKVAMTHGRFPDLELEVEGGISACIEGTYLARIVEELVDNAFKFSPPGTPVRVTLGAGDDLSCTIADRGRGMDEDDLRRLGAYLQLDRRLHEQQGAGLGFAVARGLVELHGGHLELESVPGRGTTVTFTLPGPPAED